MWLIPNGTSPNEACPNVGVAPNGVLGVPLNTNHRH